MEARVHLFGIRHHGPGSAALLRDALDALGPACVLIEGPPEADDLIAYAGLSGMKPPVALLCYAPDNAHDAFFSPFAEFSPEWQAIQWALGRQRPVRFIDWPAAVSLADRFAPAEGEDAAPVQRADPLDMLAEAAGFGDGEAFWNTLVEHHGGTQSALQVFVAIEHAMTEARAVQFDMEGMSEGEKLREARREAFMRIAIRQALKETEGDIAVVVGAWHVSALSVKVSAADDKAVVKDLPRMKVETTWVPWTDSRLSRGSGYGAGVISPGWYRHLWSLYSGRSEQNVETFAAQWQAKTAGTLRGEGFGVSTASAIEGARLALGLSALRGLSVPGLSEMRDASLSALCYGNEVTLGLIESKLFIGERVGEIDETVPQMPLARDLVLWQKKTRLKPEDIQTEVRLDLRSEAGLLKSTLLHRLILIGVPWGRLIDAEAGRGTFREIWLLHWTPGLSVSLAEALVYGVTIEQAAAAMAVDRAGKSTSITELAGLIRQTLVADLEKAATLCIARLQAAAVQTSDITDLMQAVTPLVQILRYGTARKLPEEALGALVTALCVEINAGVRTGSHQLDDDATAARLAAMRAYDEAVGLVGDTELAGEWRRQLAVMVDDDQVAQAVAGLSLRRLHDARSWDADAVAAAFSRHIGGQPPAKAGAFLETFLGGASEVILQDRPLLDLIDSWLSELSEDDFIDSLPILRRSFSGFDATSKRRLLSLIIQGRQITGTAAPVLGGDNPAFERALPLLRQILGMADG